MLRSVVAAVLAFALGVLPAVYDVCGPECSMGDTAASVAVIADEGAEGACPLHPATSQPPVHDADLCTHDHAIVREAPRSTSALASTVSQPLHVPIALFASAGRGAVVRRVAQLGVSPSVDRSSQLLALRI